MLYMSVIIKRKIFVFALLAFIFPLSGNVYAASVEPSAQNTFLSVGDEQEIRIHILNDELNEKRYKIGLVKTIFAEDRSIARVQVLDQSDTALTLEEQEVSVLPGETKDIIISVHAETLDPGFYTYGVQVMEVAGQDEGVIVSSGYISHIFLTVGEQNGAYVVNDFSIDHKNGGGYESYLSLKNTGNGLVQPIGTIEVKGLFGKVILAEQVNPDQKRLLPGQEYIFTNNFEVPSNIFSLGYHRMILRVSPWIHANEFKEELTIFVFPWRLTIFVGVIVAVLITMRHIKNRLNAQL